MPLVENVFSNKHRLARKNTWNKRNFKKLNIGIYSTLFIDDNAAEIEKVKMNTQIKVLHLPKDPSQYTKELKITLS